jgi:hypothetical protein
MGMREPEIDQAVDKILDPAVDFLRVFDRIKETVLAVIVTTGRSEFKEIDLEAESGGEGFTSEEIEADKNSTGLGYDPSDLPVACLIRRVENIHGLLLDMELLFIEDPSGCRSDLLRRKAIAGL